MESSGTSGWQLKLIDYRLISTFPNREKPSCAFVTLTPEFVTAETRYYARFLNAHSAQILNNF